MAETKGGVVEFEELGGGVLQNHASWEDGSRSMPLATDLLTRVGNGHVRMVHSRRVIGAEWRWMRRGMEEAVQSADNVTR